MSDVPPASFDRERRLLISFSSVTAFSGQAKSEACGQSKTSRAWQPQLSQTLVMNRVNDMFLLAYADNEPVMPNIRECIFFLNLRMKDKKTNFLCFQHFPIVTAYKV